MILMLDALKLIVILCISLPFSMYSAPDEKLRSSASGNIPTVGQYHILWSKVSKFCLVQVVRVVSPDAPDIPVDFMLCNTSVIGAEFVPNELRGQSLFGIFTVLQFVQFLQPKPRRVLVLGLGSGTVPAGLRRSQIYTDVIEISPEVVTGASHYFVYGDIPQKWGSTLIGDMRDLLFLERAGGMLKYDVVIHDVCTGSNSAGLLSREIFSRLRDAWLNSQGLLVVNFVGFHLPNGSAAAAEAYPLSIAIAETLRAVFNHVQCYREVPLTHIPNTVTNIICLAANHVWDVWIPDDEEHRNVVEMSPTWIVTQFQKWEILSRPQKVELGKNAANIIIEDTAEKTYIRASEVIAAELLEHVQKEVLPNSRFWDQLTQQMMTEPQTEL